MANRARPGTSDNHEENTGEDPGSMERTLNEFIREERGQVRKLDGIQTRDMKLQRGKQRGRIRTSQISVSDVEVSTKMSSVDGTREPALSVARRGTE
ncbi:hypothetical protein F0562_016292 [Nyssa sinensis]|uniref:Uncharacterized protein n=1 Tax=Nyssa sinensis TaxID=561372 RepID=A0A5J4ZMB4_9ASTE|nr:hypothetical protein F0562_016292 [Nyssa sinensis]